METNEMDGSEGYSLPANTACLDVVHNGYVYRTLHEHPVDSRVFINEAGRFKKLDDDWQVCYPDADSIAICASHAWGAHLLVFANGSTYVTASGPQYDTTYVPGELSSFIATMPWFEPFICGLSRIFARREGYTSTTRGQVCCPRGMRQISKVWR